MAGKNKDKEQKQKKIVSKTDRKEKENNRSEKIKGHYVRTFYYSFLISFMLFGLVAVFIFIYTHDKNFFGFSQRYYDRAVEYMEKGDVDAAQKELEECLDFDETYTRARNMLADIYIDGGKYSEAEELLKKSIELSPRSTDAYLEYIKVLAVQNKFEAVFDFINNITSSYMNMKILEKLPSSPSVSPSPGNYDAEIKIELSADENCKIYYTTDGSTPDFSSNVYDGTPITLSKNSMNIRAVSANENGYISNEFNSVFSVYNSNTEYKFTDEKVEAIVRIIINKPKGTVLYGDLESLTTFTNASKETSAVEGKIISLEDLSAIPNLTTVVIHNEKAIKDYSSLSSMLNVKNLEINDCDLGLDAVSEISSMTWLESLNLDKNLISDISPISRLVKLKSLSVSDNNIKDITGISGLTNLTELNISKNFIQDISGLSSLNRLKTLKISENLISSVSAVSEFSSLREFDASGNQISSAESLRRLIGITSLDLSNNKLTNVSPLFSLTSLTNLNIASNSADSIDGISELSNLSTLNISGNKISDLSGLVGMNIKYFTATNMELSDDALVSVAGMSKLQSLDIRNNKIVDVSPLASLSQLTNLTVSGNIPKNLSVLTACPKLNTVNCSNSTVSDADIYALRNKGITVITD